MNAIYNDKKFSIFEDSLDIKGLIKTRNIKLSKISTVESNRLLKTITIKTKDKKKYSIQIPLPEYFDETVNFLQGRADSESYIKKIKELDIQKPELEKKYKKKRNYIILGIISIFIILTIIGSNSEPIKETNTNVNIVDDKKIEKKKDLTSEAYTMAQVFIEKLLKSPSTANFPWLDRTIKEISKNKFKIVSYVDSQNSFGATVRTHYSIILEYKGTGDVLSEYNWKVVELYIDGKKVISNNNIDDKKINKKPHKIGSVIDLGDLSIKVISIKEVSALSGILYTRAAKGAKFVVLNVEVTNKLKQKINFSEKERFVLIDEQKRIFTPYDTLSAGMSNSLFYTDLSPSISKRGKIVFEIPKGDKKYGFSFETIDGDYELLIKK